MKKIIKMSLFIMIISLCAIFNSVNVKAQEPGITLTKKTYIYTNNRKEARFLTSNGYAYCITPNKVGAQAGQYFSYKEKETDKGLIYLLANANSNNEHNYLVTQLAIWKYYNGGFTPEAYKGTKVNNEANALATKARNAKTATTKVTIDFKVTNTDLFLNSDSTYYKSANMKAIVTGASTYTVNVQGPTNIQLVRSDGTVVANNSSFNSGEVFYVRIAESNVKSASKVSIKVAAKGKTSVAKRYTPNNNQLQELILLSTENVTVSKASTLRITPAKRVCEFYNNKYYDKNGNVTDYETFAKQCEKHKCEKVGETYFGRDGKIVPELTYRKECEKHTCEKVGDTYFGKEGNEVSELTYKQECERHICEKVGDIYFGKEGTKVSELTYKQECERHVCEKVGETYYGKNGTEVSSLTYTKECEKHTCEIIDNTYFGKSGNEVNYDTYKSQCMHFCELYNNKYYGSDGTIVDEKTYTSQCTTPVVPVPDTDTDPLDLVVYILFGSLLLLSGLFVVAPSTKKM